MSTIADLRAAVRLDLSDPDGERWSDADLDRAIGRAVARFSLACPREARLLYDCVEGERQYDLLSDPALTELLAVRRVEYPAGRYPAVFVPFALVDNGTVVLLVDPPPEAGEVFAALLDRYHVVDVAGSTLPPEHESLVEGGAAGYAAEERAAHSIDRVNLAADVVAAYERLAQSRLATFERELRDLRRRRVQRGGTTVSISGYEV